MAEPIAVTPDQTAGLRPARADHGSARASAAIVWVFAAAGASLFFLIGLAGGSFQGKLSDVQKNDNSRSCPARPTRPRSTNAQEVHTDPDHPRLHRLPAHRGSPPPTRPVIADVAAFARIQGVAADQVGPPISKAGSRRSSISVPLVGKQNGKSGHRARPGRRREGGHQARPRRAPGGLIVHSAGAGGLLVAFIDAFSGLDGTLLLSAGVVVIVILLVVYRSPVLWFFPLFSAVLALGAASIVIYPLAKRGTITLNGQSQGILSVLVIGAGTDYALLLVSRYREELHDLRSRVEAMMAAWRGAAPPIAASAVTVILGLICLRFAELNSTGGLGPVCAIGIASTRDGDAHRAAGPAGVSGPVDLLAHAAARRPPGRHRETHGVWGRFAAALADDRRRSWVGAGVVLVACVGRDPRAEDRWSVDHGRLHQQARRSHRSAPLRRRIPAKGAGAPAISLPTPTRPTR